MISETAKQQIDAKLKLANIENATTDNCGKLKRVAQLLYNDDKEKKLYMMLEIAKKNPYVAMTIAKDLKNNEEIINAIMTMMEQETVCSVDSALVSAIKYFHQGKMREFIISLGEIAEELKWDDIEKIVALFHDFGEVVQFLEMCLVNNLVCDGFFTHIIEKYNFDYGDVLANQKEIYAIMKLLLEKQCYNTCMIFIKKISVFKFYRLYHIPFSDFERILINQNIIENTDKFELGYCKASYKKGFNSYQSYRNKYKNEVHQKVYWFYLSLLYEYLHTGEFSERHLGYFKQLDEYPMGVEDATSGEMFSMVAYAIRQCICNKCDVKELLGILRRINISRMDYEDFLVLGRYDRGVLSQDSGIELLKQYQNNGCSQEELLELYFNSYLKYAVEINKFLQLCCVYDNYGTVFDSWVQDKRFIGRIVMKDERMIMIRPSHFISAKSMVYRVPPQDLNKFEKGKNVNFRLKAQMWHVEMEDVQPEDALQELQEEKVMQSLNDLKNICDNDFSIDLIKNYLSDLEWNRVYGYERKNVYYDFRFFSTYTAAVSEIMEKLVSGNVSLEHILELYMNNFFKVALSLNDLWNILGKRYTQDSIVDAFGEYVFCMKKTSKEKNSYSPLQMKAYFCHMAELDEKIHWFDLKCMARFKAVDGQGNLWFMYDQQATYETLISEGLKAMLRGFKDLLRGKHESKEIYLRIKKVPLEYYKNNLELKSQIAHIIRQTMEKKAYNPYALCEYIKGLSLHNIYCSRLFPDVNWEEIIRYQYDESLIQRAINMTKILGRNADRISRCFFVYINSFLKQYINVADFLEMCVQANSTLLMDEVSYDVRVMGNIEQIKAGLYVFKATNVDCDTVFPVDVLDETEKICAILKLSCNNRMPQWQMVRIQVVE